MGKQGSITDFFRPSRPDDAKRKQSIQREQSSKGISKRPRISEKSDESEMKTSKTISPKLQSKSTPSVPSKEGTSKKEIEASNDQKQDTEASPSIISSKEEDNSKKTKKLSQSKTSAKSKDHKINKKEETNQKDGKPIPYKQLAETFAKVEQITGRLEIQAILCDCFRDILTNCPEDLVPAIYLSSNKLAPAHEGIELGIGESILLKAISQVTGKTIAALKSDYKQVGDLGDVASSARTTQKTMFPPPPLTVRKVFSELRTIASIAGKNTQDAKRGKIVKMLVAGSNVEVKYLCRALLGKLRIHLADKTVITAIASAIVLLEKGVKSDVLITSDGKKKSKLTAKEEGIEDDIKEATVILNSVYSQLPMWDIIIPKLLEFQTIDERLVDACRLVPGVPVSPMLAKPSKAISEVLERFAEFEFTCEYKYDGERAQVHRLEDGSVKIYSRNAENLTPKYPDLVEDLPKMLKESHKKSSFIVDCEAVAYDIEKKKILPFQELQGRKRKDVTADDVTVKVCLFAFDLLFFDGESLIHETLRSRRETLASGFDEHEGQFMFAKGHDSRDPEEIMELLNASVKEGCEGLMVKALEGQNSTYEPANRSQNWLKVKKDYLDGVGDSLDLVPLGGYYGRGKRTGSFGAFLLACYDPDSEQYQSVCKIGTGFSEADIENISKFYTDSEEERSTKKPKSYYEVPSNPNLKPDVWFEPVQVWEVKCADLSISPQHRAAAGQVDPDKGIALRFPRFLRIRDDKKPEEATSAEQVAELYVQQSSIANNA